VTFVVGATSVASAVGKVLMTLGGAVSSVVDGGDDVLLEQLTISLGKSQPLIVSLLPRFARFRALDRS
jgi:hypothetical protein